MQINMKDWKNKIIEEGRFNKKAFPILSYPALKLLGNYTVADMVTNPEIHFECLKTIFDNFDMLAIATAMDLSVEAEEFGSEIRFSDDEVPSVISPIVKNIQMIEDLNVPQVGQKRSKVVLETLKKLLDNIDSKPVFGSMIGPFSLAARLFDMSELMVSLYIEPESVHNLLEKCTEFLTSYAKKIKQTGANGVLIAEPAAGLLSPEQCCEFSSRYIKSIVDSVQDDYFMVILHNCGNTENLVGSMVSTGCMGLHFGNSVDMQDIIVQIPDDILVFGNLDPVSIFKNGNYDEVYNKTIELLEKMKEYGNFVISSGCDIPYGALVENIEAFFKAVKDFNKV